VRADGPTVRACEGPVRRREGPKVLPDAHNDGVAPDRQTGDRRTVAPDRRTVALDRRTVALSNPRTA